MTYIDLINQFWRKNREHSLSASELHLYFKLLDTCNGIGWKNPFTHANNFICGELNISVRQLSRIRSRLKKVGLIDYKLGVHKKSMTEYNILGINVNNTDIVESDTHEVSTSGSKNVPSSVQQSDDKVLKKGRKMSTIIRQRKDKDKDKDIKEPNGSSSSGDDQSPSFKKIVQEYNLICTRLPKATTFSKSRKKSVGARLTEHGYDKVMKMLQLASESDFLAGCNQNEWSANIDWLFRPTNFVKVLEGNYINKTGRLYQPPGKPSPLTGLLEVYTTLKNENESNRENTGGSSATFTL